jgi:Cys-rich protein (TIGR01571 family)
MTSKPEAVATETKIEFVKHALPAPERMRKQTWNYGLCGCMNDCNACCTTTFCYPCSVASTSAILDNNPEACLCFYPGGNWKNRLQTESMLSIEPAGCFTTCLIAYCCPICSAVQVRREVKAHVQAALYNSPQQQRM